MDTKIQQTLVLEQLLSQDIPELDLYMDQVIQLFASCYVQQQPEDKGLTKTMINNYAKGKLFPPTKNKKYNKTQIMLMNFIFQLKGTLSLTEIKSLLAPLNAELMADEAAKQAFFSLYEQITELTAEQHERFLAYLAAQQLEQTTTESAKQSYEETLAQVVMLAHISNLSRVLAQQMIANLAERS